MDKETSRTIIIVVAILAATYLLVQFRSGGSFGLGSGEIDYGNQPSQPSAPSVRPTQQEVVEVSIDNDPLKGKKDAPVTVIEFSDFQCPFCGRSFQQYTSPQGPLQEYIDSGKVRFVYRDFPLDNIHPEATPAALAAECANEQGKFWAYHDKIFENQAQLSTANLKQWAADLGLDTAKFNDCLDSRKYAEEVQQDYQDGIAAGVSGTPTFFINGKKLVGAQPWTALKAAIDAELS